MKRVNVLTVVLVAVLMFGAAASADIVTGLQVNYDFETGFNDVSGNGNDGTVVGNDVSIINDAERGNVIELNLVFGGSYVDVPVAAMNPSVATQEMTVSYWAKSYDYGAWSVGTAVDSALTSGYTQNIHTYHGYYDSTLYHDGYANVRTSTTSTDFDNWHMYTFSTSYSAATGPILSIYIDDTLVATGANGGFAEAAEFGFGGLTSTGKPVFPGWLDELRVYDRALAECDVAELYAIPEPATLAILGLGSLLAFRRKRA